MQTYYAFMDAFIPNFAAHNSSSAFIFTDVSLYDVQLLDSSGNSSWFWLRIFPFWLEKICHCRCYRAWSLMFTSPVQIRRSIINGICSFKWKTIMIFNSKFQTKKQKLLNLPSSPDLRWNGTNLQFSSCICTYCVMYKAKNN